MRCFYHSEAEAVGICGACGKGLCRGCAHDMDYCLACRDKCEADVQVNHKRAAQNRMFIEALPRAEVFRGAGYTIAGVGMFYIATLFLTTVQAAGAPPEVVGLAGFFFASGALAIVIAASRFFQATKLRRAT